MPRKNQRPYRAGTVAIVGRPNVGKSTLLNRVLGEHVAIVSPRPQTTRSRILGVQNLPGAQLVFFDTPGLHKAKGALNRHMVETALRTLGEVDVVLFLIEAGTGPGGRVEVGESTRWAIEEVRRSGKPAVLGVNKMDRAPRQTLLPVIDAYRELHAWEEIVPFSALEGENVDQLLEVLARHLPEADAPLFPPDVLTDQAERQLAAEYVREQADGPDAPGDPVRGGGRGGGVRRVGPPGAGRAGPDRRHSSAWSASRRRPSSSGRRAPC